MRAEPPDATAAGTAPAVVAGPSRSRSRFFYGWWIVVIAGAGNLLAGGLYVSGLSLYFLPLSRDLGLSRAAVSLAFTLKSLEGGLDAPLVGYLVDRFGPRFMFVLGGMLAGLGFVLLAFTQDFVSFLVVFLGVLVLGFNFGLGLPLAAAVNHWFVRRRTMALTLTHIGAEIGGAALAPLIALSVVNFGWRTTAALSGITIMVVVPILAFFLRNTPESVGMRPDGEPPLDAVTRPAGHGGTRSSGSDDFVVRQAIRTVTFWNLAIAIGARLFSKNALLVHLIPLLVWKGFDEQTAAIFLSLFALLQIPLRIVAAYVADRWSMTRVSALAAMSGVCAAGVLLLGEHGWVGTGLLFVLFFALGETGNSPAWAVIGTFFGRANYASIRGSVSFVQTAISLPAPVLAGWIYDTTQSYQVALLAVVGAYLTAFTLFWVCRPPRPLALRESAGELESRGSGPAE